LTVTRTQERCPVEFSDEQATPSPSMFQRIDVWLGPVLADHAIRARMLDVAQEPVGDAAERFALLTQRDSDKYAPLAKLLNMRAEASQ
jgi:hypothetical protein